MLRWSSLLLLFVVGCGSSPAPDVAGCGKDTDCKGDRICVQRSCVSPSQLGLPLAGPSVVAPAPVAPEPVAPEPVASSAAAPAPVPAPTATVSSGQRPPPRCGCGADDLMCQMKCAQQGNAAGPAVLPNEHIPPPGVPEPHDGSKGHRCGCAPSDLMCAMKCGQKR